MVARGPELVTQCYKVDRASSAARDVERVEDGAGTGGKACRGVAAE
jgi:hypothetical protein